MKFRILYGAATLLFAGLTMSNSFGPAASRGERSGASGPTCAQCHNGNSSSASITVQLVDANSNAVTQYVGGQTYTVRVLLAGGSAYGFNARVVGGNNTTDAGLISTPSSNAQITNASAGRVAEQNAPSSSGTFTFQWTAPAAGTGNVRIFASGIAANGNGNDDSGDTNKSTSLTIAESTASSVENSQADNSLAIFPNPASEQLQISLQSASSQELNLQVYNLSGQVVKQQQVQIGGGSQQISLDIQDLPAGTYILGYQSNTGRKSQLFVKK